MFKPIRVDSRTLKWLQDNGIVFKEPHKIPTVPKDSQLQFTPKKPEFKLKYESTKIIDSDGKEVDIWTSN